MCALLAVMLVHRDRKTNAYAYGPNASVQQILAERDGLPAPRECIMLYTDITVRNYTPLSMMSRCQTDLTVTLSHPIRVCTCRSL